MNIEKFLLLTGATGLLGRFLMRDFMARGFPLAVLVRPTRRRTAVERIEDVLNRGLPAPVQYGRRPVVVEGYVDGATGAVCIAQSDRDWISSHVGSVVHCAASLEFDHSVTSNEPFRTNVDGTQALIGFCRSNGIRSIHYVSTAYICGDRRGPILETDVDCGQATHNAYEKSKLIAEALLATQSDVFDSVTIYRPSIIVGDYTRGFTSTFHGFYLPLKILQVLLPQNLFQQDVSAFWSALGMSSQDSKNLVPVDWVSAAMTRIVGAPSLHGRTYHLTNRRGTSVGLIGEVFADALSAVATESRFRGEVATVFETFSQQMTPYRAYWGDDPEFDRRHLEAALPDFPAPVLSHRALLRLVRFALEHRFVLEA
jgi:thioester reductase-like protein